MLVGELADEPERGRALFHDKANVGRLGPPLGYDIEGGADDVARVAWRETDLTKSGVFGAKMAGPSRRKVAADVIAAVLCVTAVPTARWSRRLWSPRCPRSRRSRCGRRGTTRGRDEARRLSPRPMRLSDDA
jgi:hypothetical protein